MKALRYFYSALLFISALLVASCTEDISVNVHQDSIYAEYRLVYEEAEDISYARATFRFEDASGTVLELSEPAEVTTDGTPLVWKSAAGWYETQSAGIDSAATLIYTDLDNNSFENDLLMASSIGFPSDLDSISKSATYTLEWDGAPLATNESVIVTINGINEGDMKVFIQNAAAANEIVLDKDKLEGIETGEATIFMERYTVQNLLQGTTKGGTVWSQYITTPAKVQITD